MKGMTGALNPKSVCPNCFSKLFSNGHCPSCGHVLSVINPNALLAQTYIGGGRYILGNIIGAGGFGLTYRAYDTWNDIQCAIKEYLPNKYAYRSENHHSVIVKDRESEKAFVSAKETFISEISALMDISGIRHVVRILDYFEENNTVYYVMEYLSGDTLAHKVKETGFHMPFSMIRQYIAKTGQALDVVHKSSGVLHRDISPENIMVLFNGDVKLIDFGSAKQYAGQRDEIIAIKPQYAALEQFVSGIQQGPYTDLYALAASTYYLATGVHIPTAPERKQGAVYEPLCNLNKEVDEKTSKAIDKALELLPQNRFRTVGEFLAEFSPGDISTVGQSGQSPFSRAKGRYRFLMERVMNGQVTRSWEVSLSSTISVGRSVSCDICISDVLQMSREHCLFYVNEGKLAVLDKSSNGTWINGIQMPSHGCCYVDNNSVVAFGIPENTFMVGMVDEQ